MIFGNDRGALRRSYAEAWHREQTGAVLSPLDAQIAAVVRDHPEYHAIVESQLGDDAPDDEATGSAFFHMGLHLAIREQVSTNRPAGIRAVFQTLCSAAGDPHAAEHRMVDVLAETAVGGPAGRPGAG